MKLQEQISNPEQSFKLKELGIAQRVDGFWWADTAPAEAECFDDYMEKAGKGHYQLKIDDMTDRDEYIKKNRDYHLYLKWNKWDLGENPTLGMFLKGDHSSAFSVAELGVMLPSEYHGGLLTTIPPNEGTEYNWCVTYMYPDRALIDKTGNYCDGDTEAQARAAMLIYLLENNIITANEVNERLISPS